MPNGTIATPGSTTSLTPIILPSSPNAPSPNTPTTVIQTSTVPPTTVQPSNTQAAVTPTPLPLPPTTSQTPTTSSSRRVEVTSVSTSIVTEGSPSNGGNGSPSLKTILITSTSAVPAFPPDTSSHTSRRTSSPTSSGTSAPVSAGTNQDNSSGLSPQSRIAVAVVVPIVAVALLVLAGLFVWRKRKQRKDAEELRRKEVEEYGFNPNNDPTLPTVGGASSNGDDPSEMKETDGAGYRGWGTTSTNRKPSTTLSSGNGGIGVARSGSGSDPGGYHAQGSPTAGTNQSSDVQSGDPLVANGRPLTADSETIGALGAAPAANGNRQDRDIHRGPSNASSAYSGAHRSDTSTDGFGASGQQYHNEGIYYDEGMPQHGPYGDGTYGGGQPVIRDVPARRNTRIENPSVFPQQGSAGIAQNF
ncbi:MAG: hypothetical protein Q9167_003932 [Letrouitia subvulpina]